MWTQFWDMHSGGGQKEKWAYIYIEAKEDEAKIIFYNRFGHNPERVTCTCCGDDYSISSKGDLAQLTGFHRNCRNLVTPQDPKTRLYKNDDPVIRKHLYLEDGEKPPEGYEIDITFRRWREYQTLEEYKDNDDVLIIYDKDIKPEECIGQVPKQGYVWID